MSRKQTATRAVYSGPRVGTKSVRHIKYGKSHIMSPTEIQQLKERILYLRSNLPYMTNPTEKQKKLDEIRVLNKALHDAYFY